MKHGITEYHEDPDMRFIIDEVQAKFKCCGAYTFNDWNHNSYFKCSSGAVPACGVPSSCCKSVSETALYLYSAYIKKPTWTAYSFFVFVE